MSLLFPLISRKFLILQPLIVLKKIELPELVQKVAEIKKGAAEEKTTNVNMAPSLHQNQLQTTGAICI